VTGGKLHEGQTRPPRRFTDELLIGAMENVDRYLKGRGPEEAPGVDEGELRSAIAARGLGTSATRDKVIEVLLQRGFAERKGKEVRSTAFGRYLIRALEERGLAFLTEVETTAGWEVRLQKIERGEPGESRLRFLRDLTEEVRSAVAVFERTSLRKLRKSLGETDAVCPRSGKRLVDYGLYYRAPGWPRLRLYKEVSGRTMRPEEYAAVLAALDGSGAGEAPTFEFRSASKGTSFRAGFRLDGDRLAFGFAPAGVGPTGASGGRRPTAAKDPKNGKPIEEDEAAFYVPSAPQLRCPKVLCGRAMSLEEYVALYRATILEKRPSQRFEGFVSQRTGKPFSARLKPAQGRWDFDFGREGAPAPATSRR
jgi:DNA topoisomerase-3